MKLQNNVQVARGSDVTIDISSLSSNEHVNCVFAPGGEWSNEVQLCDWTSPNRCNENTQNSRYKNRVGFTDTTTLEIKDVRPDDSGIYKCETVFIPSVVLISGIIVFGRLLPKITFKH